MDNEHTFLCHVGAVPTASWALNKVLTSSEPALRARGIAVVPSPAIQKTFSHDPDAVDVPALSSLITHAHDNGVHTVVATAEAVLGSPFGSNGDGLYPDCKQLLAGLAAATRGRRPIIVLSVCAQPDFLNAYFERMVGGRRWERYEDWLSGIDLDDLSWLPLKRRLVDQFGADAVRVVAGHGPDPRAEIINRIAGFLGDGVAAELGPVPSIGPQLSAKGLELGIAAAPHLHHWRDRHEMGRFLMRRFNDSDYPGLAMLDEQRRQSLAARYHDDLKAAEHAS